MDSIEQFFSSSNFDVLIKQALEKDIIHIGNNTDTAISGFGLCTNWTIDCSPSEFWNTAVLTEEGVEELDSDELYATGSWDGFDQGGDTDAAEITNSIYEQMWAACEDLDDEEAFYEHVRSRCAEILVSCIPLIKQHFTTTEHFFVSIAEHDEECEAKERMAKLLAA
ncbi:hypothetical protein [Shewanella waksmanii]|uniref:hypothetical protein n=1 Tax=Shewanella waksmanii TaxID=213783 RepID=UPI00048E530E|nr:hypothetical protein [Shewanella waksmanii]